MENVQEEKTTQEVENSNKENDKIDILLKENELLKQQNQQIMHDLNMFKNALLSQSEVKNETQRRADNILNIIKKIR